MDELDGWDLSVEEFDSLEKDALCRMSQRKKQKQEMTQRFDSTVKPHEDSRHHLVKGLPTYLLFESISGYAILLPHGVNDVEEHYEAVQNYINRFSKIVDLIAFHPFESEVDALKQFKAISKGRLTEQLKNFLKLNLPKPKTEDGKKHTYVLGVGNATLARHIGTELRIACESSNFLREVFRGVRMHIDKFIKDLKLKDLEKAQLNVAHSFSMQTLS